MMHHSLHNSQKRKWVGNKMDIEIETKKQALANYTKNNNRSNNRNNFYIEPKGLSFFVSIFFLLHREHAWIHFYYCGCLTRSH